VQDAGVMRQGGLYRFVNKASTASEAKARSVKTSPRQPKTVQRKKAKEKKSTEDHRNRSSFAGEYTAWTGCSKK
jgi:hypothetical protein